MEQATLTQNDSHGGGSRHSDARTAALVRDLLSGDAAARAEAVRLETGEPLESVVTRLGLVSEQVLAKAFAKASGLRLIASADFPRAAVEGATPSAAFLRDMRAVPVALADGRLTIALANPFDAFAAEALGFSFACPDTKSAFFTISPVSSLTP